VRFVHGMFTTASTGQVLDSDDIEDTGRILRYYMIPSMPHAAAAATSPRVLSNVGMRLKVCRRAGGESKAVRMAEDMEGMEGGWAE
jgi:hypothetical protein